MQGRVILVTGASSGIGLETAKALAAEGATVALVGRSPERTAKAEAAVKAEARGGAVHVFRADFSKQDDVRALAEAFLATGLPLHGLVNNAGLWHQEHRLSAEGFEDTFAVNHLAPFLLTHLLLPRMLASEGDRRIVHVSSRLHEQAGQTGGIRGRLVHAAAVLKLPRPPGLEARFELEDLQMTGAPFSGLAAYARSKLAQLLFSNELDRRLAALGPARPTSNAVHPGSVSTDVTRDSKLLSVGIRVAAPFLKSPAEGAATSVYAMTAPERAGRGGLYLADERVTEASPAARDEAMAGRLWELSLGMVGLRPEELAEPIRA